MNIIKKMFRKVSSYITGHHTITLPTKTNIRLCHEIAPLEVPVSIPKFRGEPENTRIWFSGHKLKAFRLQQQLTQGEFAKKVGYSTSYYNRLENKREVITLATATKIAEAFNVEVMQFQRDPGETLINRRPRGYSKNFTYHIYSGYKVRYYRNKRKLSKGELADLLGIDVILLSHLESGSARIKDDMAERLANVLKIKISDIMLTNPKRFHGIN